MIRRLAMAVLALTAAAALPQAAFADPITLKMLSNQSRATFKTDAPLETIVGTTAGPGVTATLPVDPAQPAEHSDLKSQVMRNQLNAIEGLIDAVPAGPQGPRGDAGPPGEISGAVATMKNLRSADDFMRTIARRRRVG